MGKDSKIEWTHHTFNPWWGCTRVSPGCEHCYAERMAKWRGHDVWGPKAERRELSANHWKEPIAWNAAAARNGTRARVFCASMADVFEDRRDLDARREQLWGIIESTPHLDWLLLTKRPQNVASLAPWTDNWPRNVWLGATAEDQQRLDERLPALTSLAARVLFLSCEPLLGPVDLSRWVEGAKRGDNRAIDWLIAGGESGPKARPMHPEWLCSLRDQSVSAAIRFYFKQWGEWRPSASGPVKGHASQVLYRASGEPFTIVRLGKKKAGRLLQGRTWDEFPDPNYDV